MIILLRFSVLTGWSYEIEGILLVEMDNHAAWIHRFLTEPEVVSWILHIDIQRHYTSYISC
ncbi:hypothetical protein BBG47_11210 [Paenibacillus sp. KS1]|nr:hypothetical protein BBG47_11210 [Paenibacillus sp. KS1]